LVAFQLWICCRWIQKMNWFKCIVTNNWCWLNNYGNIVTECHKLPYVSCKNYLISMSNKFGVLPTQLCIWPSLLGRLLGCQKSTNWKYLWFPFFLLFCWYLMKMYICCNRLFRLVIGSFNQLYSFNLRTWLFLWLNHLTNMLLQCF
jgi:hypothetical protein